MFVLQCLTQHKLDHDCFGHYVRFPSRSSLLNCESERGNQFVFEARRYDLRGFDIRRARSKKREGMNCSFCDGITFAEAAKY